MEITDIEIKKPLKNIKEIFNVIEENIKSLWNPTEDDFSKIPDLVANLI